MEIIKGILCRKYSIGYFPIPKVANTSIKHVMYQMDFGKSFSPEDHLSVIYNGNWLARKFEKPTVGPPKYRHIHKYYREKLVNISETDFRFIIVRDPVKRFLSAYSNRVLHHKELSHDIVNALPKSTKRLINFDRFVYDPSIREFIDMLDVYLTVPSIYTHIRPISTLISNLDSFNEVYPIEAMPSLEKKLSLITNSVIKIPKHQTGGDKIAISKLDLNHVEKLIKIYQNDYLMLGNYYKSDDVRKEWGM